MERELDGRSGNVVKVRNLNKVHNKAYSEAGIEHGYRVESAVAEILHLHSTKQYHKVQKWVSAFRIVRVSRGEL